MREALYVKRENLPGGKFTWSLWEREWSGGHRPEWDFIRRLTLEEAIRLVDTGKASDWMDDLKSSISPLHRLAATVDAVPDDEEPSSDDA